MKCVSGISLDIDILINFSKIFEKYAPRPIVLCFLAIGILYSLKTRKHPHQIINKFF